MINKTAINAFKEKWKSFSSNDRSYGFDEVIEQCIEAYEAAKVPKQPDECRKAFEKHFGLERNEKGFYPETTDRLMWLACKFGFEQATPKREFSKEELEIMRAAVRRYAKDSDHKFDDAPTIISLRDKVAAMLRTDIEVQTTEEK